MNNLQPQEIWQNFIALNAVPRASKKEERVIKFIQDFCAALNLETHTDEVGNVIARKPASKGYENKPTVCLQSHLDMVHQKNGDTVFDFDTQGIDMFVDGDWVKARGTTLGADNGIGVATIMGLLASSTIKHPPLEALFTIDEETGMTGALGLKGGLLSAKYMLNLDTEDDHELTIGCAGGIDVSGVGKYESVAIDADSTFYKIKLSGLTGGHSGMDIHKGRGNANKLMNRFLWECSRKINIQLNSIDGGSLRNAIPRESVVLLAVTKSEENIFLEQVQAYQNIIQKEYHYTDAAIKFEATKCDAFETAIMPTTQIALLNTIYTLPNGIYRMDSNIHDLVQSSNNVARVLVKDGQISIQCLTRSSVESEKQDVANTIHAAFNHMLLATQYGGAYPGWAPKPDSDIVKLFVAKYKELHNGEAPMVNACHAGLECGILGTNYPEMQMISFGPTITGAHSPDEQVKISSVQKYWKYLLAVLEEIE
jgi:dipeptidase D